MWNLFKGLIFILALIGTYKVWQDGNYLNNFLNFYSSIFDGTFFNQIQTWSNDMPSLQNLQHAADHLPSYNEIKAFFNL
ncbi:hypothetical protein [Staphylococcus simulans]|uniref:hypothetical protein n=1 Tax=Staphylococcus simulans TaxID=1286 RepID=UPI000D02431A|nr:hypothetical protein [Staphylococcus simulans]